MLNIQENIILASQTSFRIGGPAKFFVEVNNVPELEEALKYAEDNNLTYFILGGGSNLLVSDKGFDGLVIKIRMNEIKVDKGTNIVEAQAGVPLARIVNSSIAESMTGMEWAVGIPGTIGGAIRGNAGAFMGETGDAIESVKFLDTEDGQIKEFSKEECKFSYRDSIFKQKGTMIVVSARIKLAPGNKEESMEKIKAILPKRIALQTPGTTNAGSYFVNPVTEKEELIKEFETEKNVKSKGGKVPAGWLMEKADLKGKTIGGAMVSKDNVAYFLNTGSATAEDVVMLSSFVKQQVRDKFGVQLQEEVEYMGF
ncbi:MAG: UDP-N-acetylenolpyruvoylglucosamine reductase [Candidatus Moranbacteria bacterium CG10_big_fil_rev_8_21_14_0_10_35_21]|nr:MAG: UDP-N-acetylenolpyruvoylglucosamine reductase [Candidatus Moranbacteria bacterium CG10_big_fil_rev_8_21_14_0_10_35_21]PJA88609.1 MAG: UDP-N-acetylenolpyruvoylglucosamine reductase [Candidatus Moranbacteria bacterium CG_4_9_14_3_um_filter_36_9]